MCLLFVKEKQLEGNVVSKQTKWNFDEIIERKGTDAIKWDENFLQKYFGYGDLLPLWVADMDFRAPEALINALKKRVEHGIFGYNYPGEAYKEAVINWFKRRHNWTIEKDWILYAPGIVSAIDFIIQGYSLPGDGIIIQEPVYYPFRESIKINGREIVNNELIIENKKYQINFKDLEEKCKKPRVKMLILCSPHNPVCRVWTREELEQIGEVCLENNVIVISDEIHCDLIMPGYKHIPFATLSQKIADYTITCTAPSKSFNIAGLKISNVIISNQHLREIFDTVMNNVSIQTPTVFGAIALETVYNECEEWFEAALSYIHKNFLYLKDYVKKHLPGVEIFELEGTYLAWLDFRNLKIEPKILDQTIKKEAKVGYDDGAMFGETGKGFQRINLACPKGILQEALERTTKALNTYLK